MRDSELRRTSTHILRQLNTTLSATNQIARYGLFTSRFFFASNSIGFCTLGLRQPNARVSLSRPQDAPCAQQPSGPQQVVPAEQQPVPPQQTDPAGQQPENG